VRNISVWIYLFYGNRSGGLIMYCNYNYYHAHNGDASTKKYVYSTFSHPNVLRLFSSVHISPTKYYAHSRAPVPTDSVSAVYRGPKNIVKIEEVNGS
jgi:hypothetical protein